MKPVQSGHRFDPGPTPEISPATDPGLRFAAQNATLDDLAQAAHSSGQKIKDGTHLLDVVVPELFGRINRAELEAAAATKLLEEHLAEHVDEELPEDPEDPTTGPEVELPPADHTTPAIPVGTLRHADEYLENFQHVRTVRINPSMGPRDLVEAIGVDTAFTRVLVDGPCQALYLGGGYANSGTNKEKVVTGKDGHPLSNIEFRGTGPESAINGLRFGTSYGGIGDNVRFRGLQVRPQQNGDFSAIRTMEELRPDAVLVFIDLDINHPPEWDAFRMGAKWSCHLHGGQVIASNVIADATGEHLFYVRNMGRFRFADCRNRTKMFTDALGEVRAFGMGRTLIQEVDRIPGSYPKGGSPSWGRHEIVGCVGTRVGWEGIPAWFDKDGEPHAGGPAGGGSVFTVHGHAGEETLIQDCSVVSPYCGGIAVWNEPGKEVVPTLFNPNQYRCWMRDADGELFNPTAGQGTEKLEGWGASLVTVRGYRHQIGGNRRAIQVSGTRRFDMEDARMVPGLEGGEESLILEGHPELRVNHWSYSTPVETVNIR